MNFIQIGDLTFPTLLAFTAEEHRQGLMFVRGTPPIVSFVYSQPSVNKMWMKNTFIPLDILFCRNGQIVGFANGVPHCEDLLGPDLETDLVIELPVGMVEKFAIQVGQSAIIHYSQSSLARKISTQYF